MAGEKIRADSQRTSEPNSVSILKRSYRQVLSNAKVASRRRNMIGFRSESEKTNQPRAALLIALGRGASPVIGRPLAAVSIIRARPAADSCPPSSR
jgi:hypothetical protein